MLKMDSWHRWGTLVFSFLMRHLKIQPALCATMPWWDHASSQNKTANTNTNWSINVQLECSAARYQFCSFIMSNCPVTSNNAPNHIRMRSCLVNVVCSMFSGESKAGYTLSVLMPSSTVCLHLLLKLTHIWYLDLHLIKLCLQLKQLACVDVFWLPTWKRK